jgi:Zn-dependent protease
LPERLHLHPSLAGVPIRVGWRWLVVAAAVTAITAHELAPELREISDALAWYSRVSVVVVGVIISLGLHELAHVLAARRTSGPMLAIEPAMFGALSDTSFAPSDPPAEARVAVAGPLASLALAALFGSGAWLSAGRFDAAYDVCLFLALANGALALINLIPGYPLDGGRLLRALVWYLSDDLVVGTRVAAFYGQIVLVVGLFGGFVMLAAGQPYSVWGAWLTLAVWAVSGAARDGVARVIWREAGRRVSVEEAGLATSQRINANQTIDAAIDEILQLTGHGPMLVVDGDEIVGVFSLALVRRVPRAIWTEREVRDAARSVDELTHIDGEAKLNELLRLFDDDPDRIVLVETHGHVSGAVDRELSTQRLRHRILAERRLRPAR